MAQDVTNMPQEKQYKLSVKRILYTSCVKYHLSPGPAQLLLQCVYTVCHANARVTSTGIRLANAQRGCFIVDGSFLTNVYKNKLRRSI
jgi:hypothetical protein